MNYHSMPYFAAASLSLIIGVAVILRNKESPINLSFFLLALSTFLWQLGTALVVLSYNPDKALFFTRIGFLGIAFIPVTTYQLALAFSKFNSRKLLIFGYIVDVVLFIPLCWSNYMFNGVFQFEWGYWYRAGNLHPIFLIFFGFFMILSFYRLYTSYYKESSPSEKNRKKYLLELLPNWSPWIYAGISFLLLLISIKIFKSVKW